MPVYEQEVDFLKFCKNLVLEGAVRTKKAHNDFKGLSKEGQEYLAEILHTKTISYLLEKGGTIPNTAWHDKKRVENYSLLNYPIQLSYSKSLYHLFWKLLETSRNFPNKPQFTDGDNVVLLMVAEKGIRGWRSGIANTTNFWSCIASNAYLPRLFYPMKQELKSEEIPSTDFFKNPGSANIIFALRYFFRDKFVEQFKSCLQKGGYKNMERYGRVLDTLLSPLLDFCEQDMPQLLEPFCESYEILFETSHETQISRMICGLYGSDRQQALTSLLRCYNWVKRINSYHKKAIKIRRWEDEYEKMNIIKKYHRLVSKQAKQNAQATLDLLENVI